MICSVLGPSSCDDLGYCVPTGLCDLLLSTHRTELNRVMVMAESHTVGNQASCRGCVTGGFLVLPHYPVAVRLVVDSLTGRHTMNSNEVGRWHASARSCSLA
jgi:hypothetical protein